MIPSVLIFEGKAISAGFKTVISILVEVIHPVIRDVRRIRKIIVWDFMLPDIIQLICKFNIKSMLNRCFSNIRYYSHYQSTP